MSLLSELFPAASSGGQIKNQKFTSNGTFTPSAALLAKGGWVTAVLVGGGAGGGQGRYNNAGAGGGSGGCFVFRLKLTAAVAVTIGSAGGPAADGGDTLFGALATAYGGRKPGLAENASVNPGVPGVGGVAGGGFGVSGSDGARTLGGYGGSNPYGRGGPPNTAATEGYGGGGGGGNPSGSATVAPGFDGRPGYVEVFWEE